MTTSLKKAFDEASRLPDALQEQLATQLLEDVSGEMRWDEALANSQDLLEAMAEKARRSVREGKTIAKGFDEL